MQVKMRKKENGCPFGMCTHMHCCMSMTSLGGYWYDVGSIYYFKDSYFFSKSGLTLHWGLSQKRKVTAAGSRLDNIEISLI